MTTDQALRTKDQRDADCHDSRSTGPAFGPDPPADPGDEVVITENDEPVAKLARIEPKTQWPCKAGRARGTIHWMAPDFDAPLEKLKEYME